MFGMDFPSHLVLLLWNLFSQQHATVRKLNPKFLTALRFTSFIFSVNDYRIAIVSDCYCKLTSKYKAHGCNKYKP